MFATASKWGGYAVRAVIAASALALFTLVMMPIACLLDHVTGQWKSWRYVFRETVSLYRSAGKYVRRS